MYKTIVRKRIIALFSLLMAVQTWVLGHEQEIVLGYEDDWQDVYHHAGVVFETGRRGFVDIVLRDGEYTATEDTDLLIHFNGSPAIDETGTYRTRKSALEATSAIRKLGAGAGVFQNQPEALVLTPVNHALFSSSQSWADFTIEFWFYPATLDEGGHHPPLERRSKDRRQCNRPGGEV